MPNPASACAEAFEQPGFERCSACGQKLFSPDAEACSWQIWKALWEILGMNPVELVCGSCGEPLREFFSEWK
ncbi:MAG TPA: hypothetical protein VNM15_06370 [Candidatus Binatia bacterium]|nr:hypothetical protein [Candidatus Binatia bacterium]